VIVRTFDGVQALTTPGPSWSYESGSLNLYDRNQAYAEIYRTQPNVRICVDFLARNIAQLSPHVFRRVSDTDRKRLADHDLAQWLNRPNPSTRRFRLLESLIGDLGIYFEAYWLKVRYRGPEGRPAIGLIRLPPQETKPEGGLLPREFIWSPQGRDPKPFAPSEIVYFNGYNPCNALRGLSPLETLRRILAEESAAGDHREQYWRNASRHEGIIQVAKDGPNYTPQQLQDFKGQWAQYKAGGARMGDAPILPKGLEYKSASFSARDSEYIQGGKLRREICAAAYHIPQPMVGILDHATFSNIKEQHKHLYQDTLATWLEMIQQEIAGQLLIECEDQRDVYVEFNIAAKLMGSFEERATALQVSIGRAWRTVNEGRALDNLPRIDDPELDKVAPQQGGPADASANPPAPTDQTPAPDQSADVDLAPVIQATRDRQDARLAKFPATERPRTFLADLDRWNRELSADLAQVTGNENEDDLAAATNAAMLAVLEGEAKRARVDAIEQRIARPAKVRRTFERNADNGLIDAIVEEEVVAR